MDSIPVDLTRRSGQTIDSSYFSHLVNFANTNVFNFSDCFVDIFSFWVYLSISCSNCETACWSVTLCIDHRHIEATMTSASFSNVCSKYCFQDV